MGSIALIVFLLWATCSAIPTAEWPSPQVWDQFNQTLNGALIKTVPLAAVCYRDWPEYNPERCNDITNRWNSSALQYDPISYSAF